MAANGAGCLMDRESNGQFVTFTRLVFTADVVTFSRKEDAFSRFITLRYDGNPPRGRGEPSSGKVSHWNIRAWIKSSTDIYMCFSIAKKRPCRCERFVFNLFDNIGYIARKTNYAIVLFDTFFIESSLAAWSHDLRLFALLRGAQFSGK